MGSMRQGNQIDLTTSSGQRTVSVASTASVQFQANAQQSRIGASGNKAGMYNNVRAIMLQVELEVTRTDGSEAPIIYPDEFPRAISQIGLQCPMFGTLLDPNVVTGMLAKHVLEYFGTGYQRPGVYRQPIPAGNGAYTRFFEIMIPFSQGWNINPDHFSIWLGWLDSAILEVFVADNAQQPFGLAGVTITGFNISAVLETVPWPEMVIPPYVNLRRYQQAAAAGSNGPILMNVGSAESLQGVDDGARLVAELFSHQAGGFTGSGTADEISQIQVGWRDQIQTNFASMYFERFIRDTRLSQLGIDAATLAGGLYDNVPPYPMSANPLPTGSLADASARYTPLVWTPKLGKVSQIQKVKGNYPLDGINFSSPQSGQFTVYHLELKQWNKDRISSMLVQAGIDPGKVALVPKTGLKNNKKLPDSVTWGFPRSVVPVAAASK